MEAPSNILPSQALQEEEEDEWDAEGFVIPSLGMEDITNTSTICGEPSPLKQKGVKDLKIPAQEKEIKKEKEIYLGPHGVPPPYKQMYLSEPPHGHGAYKRRIKEEGGGKKQKSEIGRSLTNKRKIYSSYR